MKFIITYDVVMSFPFGLLLERPKDTIEHVLVRMLFAIAHAEWKLIFYAYTHVQSVPVKTSYLEFCTCFLSITRQALF